jgi:hypothetical protein
VEERKKEETLKDPASEAEEVLTLEGSPPKKKKLPWYFRIWVIILAIFTFGPLALPLLWVRPGTGVWVKVSVSVLVIAMTVWMVMGAAEYYDLMMQHMQELSAAMEGM